MNPEVTPAVLREIEELILASFERQDLVRVRLAWFGSEIPDEVNPERELSVCAFNLPHWANHEGRLSELLQQLQDARPMSWTWRALLLKLGIVCLNPIQQLLAEKEERLETVAKELETKSANPTGLRVRYDGDP